MQVGYLVYTDDIWQVAFACYTRSIDHHYPKDPLSRVFKATSRYYLNLHLKTLQRSPSMLLQMALQKDNTIPHCPQKRLNLPPPPVVQLNSLNSRQPVSFYWMFINHWIVFNWLCILCSNCFSFRNFIFSKLLTPSLLQMLLHNYFSPFKCLYDNGLSLFS